MPDGTPLGAEDAAALRARIRSGEATRVDVVAARLERIHALDPVIGGFARLREDEVLAEAAAADAERGRRLAGPLDGVPMGVKESYGIAGLPRTDGLPLLADRLASRDDTVVARLREAGALLVGHGNVPDLCVRWNTVSGLYGTTRNPRDTARTAGGSSGGEAANVAAGLVAASIGQDLGGSIRVPASFCGVYGLRTTPGVVPTVSEFPAFPPTPVTHAFGTIGPLARTVADLEAVYEAIALPEARDVSSVPRAASSHRRAARGSAGGRAGVPGPGGVPGAVGSVDAPGSGGGPRGADASRPRVAVLLEEAGAVVDAEIRGRLGDTCSWLAAAGYEVVDGVLPDLRRASELWAEITGTDLMRVALPQFGEHMTASGRAHVEDLFGAFELGADPARLAAAWIERAALYERWAAVADEYPLVVAPVAGMPAPPLGFDDRIGRAATLELFDAMRCVPWVNLLGLPALALPNGIQLVGRRFHEADLLDAAHALEPHLPVAVATP